MGLAEVDVVVVAEVGVPLYLLHRRLDARMTAQVLHACDQHPSCLLS